MKASNPESESEKKLKGKEYLKALRQLLSLIPYKKVPREKIKLPKRSTKGAYDDQATLKDRKFVAEIY